jgi:hypothetical protein
MHSATGDRMNRSLAILIVKELINASGVNAQDLQRVLSKGGSSAAPVAALY